MATGVLIDERFEVERRVASGGMGHIYVARDRLSGERVAFKVLHGTAAERTARFQREIDVLVMLSHPHIVRYIAHGRTPDGIPYLVMEWIEGATLAERLVRGPLAVAEAIDLAAGIAAALSAMHALGFIHRDLKPSNVFLERGEPAKVKVLDFGLARTGGADSDLTAPGTVLGTIGYLAPEQARGEPMLGPPVDVFSLGCLMFRAISGRKPFVGEDDLSVLIKSIIDEPPRLTELRGDVPEALGDLVARMMAKAPGDRPADGAAVLAELAAIGAGAGLASPGEITRVERRVVGLVLTRDPSPAHESALRAAAETHRGRLERCADGASIIIITSDGEATDLAARAAACALAVRARSEAPIVVVAGRVEPSATRTMGELIDRAAALLPQAGAGAIRVDDMTQGLLGARFEVDAGARLLGECSAAWSTRTLLGRPTACVGRDREIAQLEAAFARSVEEVAATAVLVTAPSGMGKSRLASEMIRRLAARPDAPRIWVGRADPVSAGSAFGLIGGALRGALGIEAGAPIAARREALRKSVADLVDGADRAARIAEFLGEIVGAPFPDEQRVELRAARRDPMLLGDQIRRAFEDLLRVACSRGPLVLVLEDLHWGDVPSVKLVDAALRHLETRPFFVLAGGRPELHQRFPDLWAGRGLAEIHLARLPRRAGMDLVRGVLGGGVTDEVAQDLVDRADGNALCLEELIRAVAEGKSASLPETVLAMVQARLDARSAEERRILRAASVLGQTFSERAVAALVGGAEVRGWLRLLADDEVVLATAAGAYRFRHELVREAAYGMLTEADRALGHLLAAEYLERSGEGEPAVLAEHFERGGDRARAARFYRRAATQAFEGNDLDSALLRANRGLGCLEDRESALAGELYLVRAEASRWLGDNAKAESSATRAMSRLPRGSVRWCVAAAEVVHVAAKLGHAEVLIESTDALLAIDRVGDDAAASYAIALARAATTQQLSAGRHALVEVLLARAEEEARRASDDPAALGQVLWARSLRALAAGDLSTFLGLVEASRASLALAGDLRSDTILALNAGHGYLQVGAFVEAERILAEAMDRAERMGLGSVRSYAMLNLGLALEGQGRLGEARAIEEDVLALFQAQGDRPREAIARTYLAMILGRAREHEAAARAARVVADDRGTTPAFRAYARAVIADVLLAEGRVAEALPEAEAAMSTLTSLDGIEEGEALIRVVYAEALWASGDRAVARAAIAEARERLMARAEKVIDPGMRRSFVERVPENARTLARAAAWLDVS